MSVNEVEVEVKIELYTTVTVPKTESYDKDKESALSMLKENGTENIPAYLMTDDNISVVE